MTVSEVQIKGAESRNMIHVRELAVACDTYTFPFFIALAIMEKETHGVNRYGHDVGGALSGFDGEVNAGNFEVFQWLQTQQGPTMVLYKSNGVGPMQLTWKGHFPAMAALMLEAWRPRDSIDYAIGKILSPNWKTQLAAKKTTANAIVALGTYYNGKSTYGADALVVAKQWYAAVGNSDCPTVTL